MEIGWPAPRLLLTQSHLFYQAGSCRQYIPTRSTDKSKLSASNNPNMEFILLCFLKFHKGNRLSFNEAPFIIFFLFVGNFAEIGVTFCRKRLNWNGKFCQNLLGEALLTSMIAVHDLQQSTVWCFPLSYQGKDVVQHSRHWGWHGPATLLKARLLPLLFDKYTVSSFIMPNCLCSSYASFATQYFYLLSMLAPWCKAELRLLLLLQFSPFPR